MRGLLPACLAVMALAMVACEPPDAETGAGDTSSPDAGDVAVPQDANDLPDRAPKQAWWEEGRTGIDCVCDRLGMPVPPPNAGPPVTGQFTWDRAFAERARARVAVEMPRGRSESWATPAYVTPDPWPDIIAPWPDPDTTEVVATVFPQTADGVWGEPVALRVLADWPGEDPAAPDRCLSLVDMGGDPAWELVCTDPFGWFEGQLQEDGTQRVLLGRDHWHPGFDTRDPMLPELFRDREGFRFQGFGLRFRDYDGDLHLEGILTGMRQDIGDYLLEQRPDGTFSAENFRMAFSFGSCDFDFDGDLEPDAVYVYKEGDENQAPNFNALYAIREPEPGRIELERIDPLPEGAEDILGWFGVATGRFDQTPMGCSRVNWLDGYFLSQDDVDSVVVRARSDNTVCSAMPCLGSWRSESRGPFHWGALFTSWRGRVHEGVVTTGYQTVGRNKAPLEYLAVTASQGALGYNVPDSGLRLPELDTVRGNEFSIVAFDVRGGDGRPDILVSLEPDVLVTDPEFTRLFENALELVPGEDILCLEILGRGGESAIVEFSFSENESETVLVADAGNIGVSPPPVVFQGVRGPADVTVRRPARAPERYSGLEPGGCYALLPRRNDGTLPDPIPLR